MSSAATRPAGHLDEAHEEIKKLAASGQSGVKWEDAKQIIASRLDQVARHYHLQAAQEPTQPEPLEDIIHRLQLLLNEFSEAPFTAQRLCEILVHPTQTYTTPRKLFNALEKLLTVSSTLPTFVVAPSPSGTYLAATDIGLGQLLHERAEISTEIAPMDVP